MSITLLNDIESHLFQMPGGEFHITSKVPLTRNRMALVRGGLPSDIIALAIWADAVHSDGGFPYLLLPYLPGARQDRRQTGEALSCKVYADLINGMHFKKVVAVDPHSDVMPALLNNLEVVHQHEVIKEYSRILNQGFTGVIAPDVGAYKKAWKVAQLLQLPLYQAFKHRDMSTGKLSGFTCDTLSPSGKYLVVDDICDGGGTFMGLAEMLGLPKEQLALYVTHGIFSGNNVENLHKYFYAIFTTDSHEGNITPFYNQNFFDIVERFSIINLMQGKLSNVY
jgi:ribose-phosphate pyrophosphokinase